jgi:DNA-binding NarL/FixJ family response regulator
VSSQGFPAISVTAGSTGATPDHPALTRRELSVVQAIQQGKSNKIIAYQLNMCESTVKVHVRNIMRKLGARNRTDVAIKAQSMLNAIRAPVSLNTAAEAA